MKKTAITLLAIAAAFAMTSCQKETRLTTDGEGMTICAVSEGIGAGTKAEMACKYDVLWNGGDNICVKNSVKNLEFTLIGGAGTTIGTFSSMDTITGEVEGFYPSSVADHVWPAEQQNNQAPPMYCKKNLSSTQNQTLSFSSLGSVLQLTFSTTSKDIVLQSIEVKADEAMSGKFTIDEEGKAIVSQEGDKPGITLDLGDAGVALGITAKKFNIAIPAGTYHNFTIIFKSKDGQICTIHSTSAQTIAYNDVNTLALSGNFALAGVFSVSKDGGKTIKKIHFSKSCLYWDGASLKFEDNQYDFNSDYDPSHVSHFTWSSTVDKAVSDSNDGDFLFCDESHKVSVDGSDAIYYALSTEEWQYLFNNHTYKWVSVNGVKGCVIAPDNFSGTIADTYADDAALAADNLVFLPATGYRYYYYCVYYVGDIGHYWSSSANDSNSVYFVYVDGEHVVPDGLSTRIFGFSVRLITESE